ncbi:MAG: NIF3 (NGG1p interacting factor 3) [bacterium ADurb.Bin400]|nr:MAG: NIF3 (NGG1p interacting factor 3) [bacterium ADurb.Bin400]
MKLQEIYDLAIQIGIDNDPRGRERVGKILEERRQEYEELPAKKKAEYDVENLTDPYSDSGFHFGDPETDIKTVLVGIDIDPGEVLLAKELERQGKKIDLIIGHHPIGKALIKLHEVMDMQVDIMARYGIPENIAEGVLSDRLSEVSRGVSPANHFQAIDAAKLLGIPVINVHTPGDNSAWNYVTGYLEKKAPETVGEIIEAIKEIPEYKEASRLGIGPSIFAGREKSRAGKIVVDFTGGTSGSEKAYERMSHYGIGTIVSMHMHEKHREEAVKHYINVVIASHMASDSLGLNIIMDELERRGVEIVPCSGFIRVSRNQQ